ncbi:MAG: SDR family NAD(P)-dependent oxidoreductase [Tranquillimonas sp.]|jgi:NAD(P)-dependent dehydrogenase (short-subunit alcohol dehydrogenase family)
MTEKKCVAITGAARGLGLATARLMLGRDWRVALLDRDAEELDRAAPALPDAVAVTCDVSDPAQVDAAIAEVLGWSGRLDALVNNAAIADFRPMEQTDFALWRRIMEVNLDGVFLMSQAAMPHLRRTRGAIVNVSSISGLRASTLRTAYGTSKAAVMHLTRQQAAEAGEWGVRANCVAPGPMDTAMARAVHSAAIRAAYHDAIPLNRYGGEDEVAEAIAFLCSDKASYITGQILSADGGFEATGVGLPALRGTAD